MPPSSALAPVGDEAPQHTQTMAILGTLLTFEPLLEPVSAKLLAETAALASTLRDLAIGVPHQLAQWDLRVAARALASIEALASATCGWNVVGMKLNTLYYRRLKTSQNAAWC